MRRNPPKIIDADSIPEGSDGPHMPQNNTKTISNNELSLGGKHSLTCERIIRIAELTRITGLSRTAIYNKSSVRSKYFDRDFPKRFKINNEDSENSAVGWLLSEVNEWIISRSTKRLFNS